MNNVLTKEVFKRTFVEQISKHLPCEYQHGKIFTAKTDNKEHKRELICLEGQRNGIPFIKALYIDEVYNVYLSNRSFEKTLRCAGQHIINRAVSIIEMADLGVDWVKTHIIFHLIIY